MVSPAATPRKSSWKNIRTKFPSSACRWLFIGILTFGFLVLLRDDRNPESVATAIYFPEPPFPSSKDPSSFLRCDDFLSNVRRRLHNNVSADEVDKIYAAYLTKYDPPFWISRHAEDKEILNKGQNLRQMEQSNLMERVLREASNQGVGDIVFFQPNDSGWFSLLAASKSGRRVVRVYDPQGTENVIRLCESILLNQWHLVLDDQSNPKRSRSLHENSNARIQIISDPKLALPPLQTLSPSPISLLKLQGDNLLTTLNGEAVSSFLLKGLTEFLWVEYYRSEERDDNDSKLEDILSRVSHSKVYEPYWPEASSDSWSSGRRSCHNVCNFWWRRRKIKTKP